MKLITYKEFGDVGVAVLENEDGVRVAYGITGFGLKISVDVVLDRGKVIPLSELLEIVNALSTKEGPIKGTCDFLDKLGVCQCPQLIVQQVNVLDCCKCKHKTRII